MIWIPASPKSHHRYNFSLQWLAGPRYYGTQASEQGAGPGVSGYSMTVRVIKHRPSLTRVSRTRTNGAKMGMEATGQILIRDFKTFFSMCWSMGCLEMMERVFEVSVH
jgi:hypothetical protein